MIVRNKLQLHAFLSFLSKTIRKTNIIEKYLKKKKVYVMALEDFFFMLRILNVWHWFQMIRSFKNIFIFLRYILEIQASYKNKPCISLYNVL